jgi:hypothetical protein
MLKIAIFMTVLSASAALAEPISLACSGTFWTEGIPSPSTPVTTSAELDLDRGTVTGIGKLPLTIVATDANGVGAKGTYVDQSGREVFVSFRIDRITGKTSVFGKRENETALVFLWDLTCKPARRLF